MKLLVQYDPLKNVFIKVGERAVICPIDHQSRYVCNYLPVITTKVISYDVVTGEFETMNTRYIPKE